MPNEEKTVDQVQPKRSEPAKYVTDTDDILTRCIAIAYRFDFLRDPEDTLKGESLERWHTAHKNKIVEWTAARTGDDPERLQDEKNLTEDQRKELAKTEALHRASVFIALNQSNYMASIKCISEYCEALADSGQDDIYRPLREEFMPQALLNGSLANVPLCATLYFFATHVDVNPEDNERTMTPEDRSALLAVFDAMDTFYREHRAEIDSERALLESFIKHEHPDAQGTAQDQNALKSLHSVAVDKLVLPNTRLANAMTSGIVDGIQRLFRVAGSLKKPVNMACILTYEGSDVTLNGRQPYDDFDENVFDAICTLYQYGDPSHVMTDAMIYNAMIGGNPDTDQPSKRMSDLIAKSINKMRFINVKIDHAKEWQRRGITVEGAQIDSDVTEHYYVKAERRKIKAGGKRVDAWLIEEQPVVFAHAEAVGQVLTVPSNLLAIREVSTTTNPDTGEKTTVYKIGSKLYNTETCIMLRGRLLRRIEGMKGKNKLLSNVVALEAYRKDGKWHDGLYDIANTHKPNENGKKPPLSRTEKDRVRSTIECILDYWISLDYIKGYEPQKRGRAITGYKILL